MDAPADRGAVPEVRRRDATKNRETLVRAARTALAEQPNASLDSIAQAAGLSRRALYGHFPDRDSLVHEVVEVASRKFAEIVGIGEREDPRVALAHLATALWRESTTVKAIVNIALSELYDAHTDEALDPLRRRLRALTGAGIASGAFRADMTPDTLARLVEEAAKVTLRDERITSDTTASTAVKVVLSIVGLSWVEQRDLLDAHPELLEAGDPPAG